MACHIQAWLSAMDDPGEVAAIASLVTVPGTKPLAIQITRRGIVIFRLIVSRGSDSASIPSAAVPGGSWLVRLLPPCSGQPHRSASRIWSHGQPTGGQRGLLVRPGCRRSRPSVATAPGGSGPITSSRAAHQPPRGAERSRSLTLGLSPAFNCYVKPRPVDVISADRDHFLPGCLGDGGCCVAGSGAGRGDHGRRPLPGEVASLRRQLHSVPASHPPGTVPLTLSSRTVALPSYGALNGQ